MEFGGSSQTILFLWLESFA